MGIESHIVLGELRRELGLQSQLSEAVQNAPFGTVVGWRTPAGKAYGVVVGKEGKELLCLSAFSKSLAKDKSLTYYEDKSASGKLQQAMPGVLMALQRVPMNRAFKRGRVEGTGLQPYLKAAAHLQLEGAEMNITEKMWIQKAVKKPGRLPKLLGLSQEKYDAMSKAEKLGRIKKALDALAGESGSEAKSKRSALILGKRFIKGVKEDGMDFEQLNVQLDAINESLSEAEGGFRRGLASGYQKAVDSVSDLESFRGLITYRLRGQGSADTHPAMKKYLQKMDDEVVQAQKDLRAVILQLKKVYKRAGKVDAEMHYM